MMELTPKPTRRPAGLQSAFTFIELVVLILFVFLIYTAFADGWFIKAWDSAADMWYSSGWFGKVAICLLPIGILVAVIGGINESEESAGCGGTMVAPSLLLLFYYGCIADANLSIDKIVFRDGVAYKVNSERPYTGSAFMEITEINKERDFPEGARFEFSFRKGLLHENQYGYHPNGQKSYEAYSSEGVSANSSFRWPVPQFNRFTPRRQRDYGELLERKSTPPKITFRWAEWYKNGQKKSHVEIINGNGDYKEWHENGEVKEKI